MTDTVTIRSVKGFSRIDPKDFRSGDYVVTLAYVGKTAKGVKAKAKMNQIVTAKDEKISLPPDTLCYRDTGIWGCDVVGEFERIFGIKRGLTPKRRTHKKTK